MKDFLSAAHLQELLPGIESAEPQGQKDPKWERDLVDLVALVAQTHLRLVDGVCNQVGCMKKVILSGFCPNCKDSCKYMF